MQEKLTFFFFNEEIIYTPPFFLSIDFVVFFSLCFNNYRKKRIMHFHSFCCTVLNRKIEVSNDMLWIIFGSKSIHITFYNTFLQNCFINICLCCIICSTTYFHRWKKNFYWE